MPQSVDELRAKLSITSLEEAFDEWIKNLIYADPGGGKTHLLGTAADHPETRPVLIFDVDGGLKTLKKFENKKYIERIVCRSMDDVKKNYDELFYSIDADGNLPYKTVGIDSLSELTDLDMRFIMKAAYNTNPDKVNIDVPSPREWGIARAHVRNVVRAFRDLPCHVIMTAHVGVEEQEGQPTKYFPAFAGKLKREVPGFFDVVGYMSTDTTTGEAIRQIQFLGTRRVVAKDRLGVFGNLLRNPSVPLMWDLISGNVDLASLNGQPEVPPEPVATKEPITDATDTDTDTETGEKTDD